MWLTYFLVDFVVLEMQGINVQRQTPIILGKLFLSTTNAWIKCHIQVMEISFGNMTIHLNVFKATMDQEVVDA